MPIRFETFQNYVGEDGFAARTYRRVAQEPSWVMKAAVIAGLLFVVLPIVILVSAALLVGLVVFFVLAAANRLGQLIRGGFGSLRGDGRKNVRVVRRSPEQTH